MSTAKQNVERAKGAAEERRWMAAKIRELLRLYGKDLVLRALLDEIKERSTAAKLILP